MPYTIDLETRDGRARVERLLHKPGMMLAGFATSGENIRRNAREPGGLARVSAYLEKLDELANMPENRVATVYGGSEQWPDESALWVAFDRSDDWHMKAFRRAANAMFGIGEEAYLVAWEVRATGEILVQCQYRDKWEHVAIWKIGE